MRKVPPLSAECNAGDTPIARRLLGYRPEPGLDEGSSLIGGLGYQFSQYPVARHIAEIGRTVSRLDISDVKPDYIGTVYGLSKSGNTLLFWRRLRS